MDIQNSRVDSHGRGRVVHCGWLPLLALLAACTGVVKNANEAGPPPLPDQPVSVPAEPGAVTSTVPPFAPGAPVLARLTKEQYANSVRDLFGSALPVPELEAVTRPHLFSVIGASTDSVSEHGVQLFTEAAYSVTQAAFADQGVRTSLVPCEVATPLDARCLRKFVEEFGSRAFRRPLESIEVDAYAALQSTLQGSDGWTLLQLIAAALLQSPNFLYRVEVGEPAPEHAGWLRYSSYEMATRLSFLLRNSLPDAELFAAAARGELVNKDGIAAQVNRLLADAAPTQAMVSQLYSEYLDLPKLEQLTFPTGVDQDKTLAASMRTEVLAMVNRVALKDATDMRTLYTTHQTAVDGALAGLYGLATPPAGTWQSAELAADGPRAGILTTGALLSLSNRPERTAPTLRGLFVRQRLLCGTVPPPPPGVPTIAEGGDAAAPQTIREKVDAHRANPACNACHQSMDPLGLGMEDFDQFGRYRTNYAAGQPVDSSGDVEGKVFSGAKQLGELLAKDDRVTQCLVRQLYRYSSSRVETETEEEVILGLHDNFASSGFQLKPLLLALTASDGFRYLKQEAP